LTCDDALPLQSRGEHSPLVVHGGVDFLAVGDTEHLG
jgi:hypothetical protein